MRLKLSGHKFTQVEVCFLFFFSFFFLFLSRWGPPARTLNSLCLWHKFACFARKFFNLNGRFRSFWPRVLRPGHGPLVLAGILLGDVKLNLKLNKAITVWQIVSYRIGLKGLIFLGAWDVVGTLNWVRGLKVLSLAMYLKLTDMLNA